MADNNTNMQAMLAARVRPACTDAFNRLMQEVGKMPYVSLHVDSAFEPSLNRVRPGSDTGPRLVIGIGDPEGKGISNYTFRFPDLSTGSKSENTRSLRYRKDGGKSSSGGTRNAVEVFRSCPLDKSQGIQDDVSEAGSVQSRTAHTVNGMSFGMLFTDPLGGLAPLAEKGDIISGAAGFAEAEAFRRVGGSFLGMAIRNGSAGAACKAYNDILDGKGGGRIPADGGRAIDRQAVWHVLADPGDVAELFAENGLPKEMADKARAALADADMDQTDLAWRGMGLDRFCAALQEASDQARKAQGDGRGVKLSEILKRHDGEQGLLYLSAYKECRDHGGAAARQPDGSFGPTGILARESQIYHKLCSLRAMGEERSREYAASVPDKGFCYLKTRGSMPGNKEEQSRCPVYMSYRFLLETAGHYSSDGVCSVLPARLYFGPQEGRNAAPVMLDTQLGMENNIVESMPLADAIRDAADGGDGLRYLPCMNVAARNGLGKDLTKWARELCTKDGGSVDALALELKAFSELRGPRGPLSKYEAGISSMERAYKAAQSGLPDQDTDEGRSRKAPRAYSYMREHAAGFPSAKYGVCDFGDGIVADAVSAGCGELLSSRYSDMGILSGPSHSVPGKSAQSLRRQDLDRVTVAQHLGLVSGDVLWYPELHGMGGFGSCGTLKPAYDGWYQALASADHGFYHDYNACLDRWGYVMTKDGVPDEARLSAAWRQNDFMVLVDCYGAYTHEDLAHLRQNVDDVHGGGKPDGPYRPVDSAEANALRKAYGFGSGWTGDIPEVPFDLQATPEGLAAALAPAMAADPTLARQLLVPFVDQSLDEGTLDHDPSMARAMAIRAAAVPQQPAQKTVGEISDAASSAVKAAYEAMKTEAMREMDRRVSTEISTDGTGNGKDFDVTDE